MAPSEASVAKVMHTCFPNRFRYRGRNKWQYYDHDIQMWVPDKGKKHLIRCIRIELSGVILQRAKIWQEHLHSLDHPDHDLDFRILRLLEVARKLQTDDFTSNVIREASEWYNEEV